MASLARPKAKLSTLVVFSIPACPDISLAPHVLTRKADANDNRHFSGRFREAIDSRRRASKVCHCEIGEPSY